VLTDRGPYFVYRYSKQYDVLRLHENVAYCFDLEQQLIIFTFSFTLLRGRANISRRSIVSLLLFLPFQTLSLDAHLSRKIGVLRPGLSEGKPKS
jgi:hypothetical protein